MQASQSTLSTGLNSVATSWTLDIQSKISSKELSFEKQTKIAQYISLGVGIVSIAVSMVLANGEIKSAYEWFNSFMGFSSWRYSRNLSFRSFHKEGNKLRCLCSFCSISSTCCILRVQCSKCNFMGICNYFYINISSCWIYNKFHRTCCNWQKGKYF